MRKAGIVWNYIHITDNRTVVIVEPSVIDSIITRRENGERFRGRFVAHDGDKWSASFIDERGDHHYKGGLTERLAYRFVLGYKIGRSPQTERYVGYRPAYRIS